MYPTYGGLGYPSSQYALPVPYGSIALTVTSPIQSFVEPISLDEIKSYLKVPYRNPPDDAEDADLTAFIIAAREQAEIFQGRDLVRKQWDLSFDYWMSARINLRDPLVSVDSVAYRDSTNTVTTLVQNTDYVVDTAKGPGVILPAYNTTWATFTPWPSSAILIRFTSGHSATSAFWSDAGARLKVGMKLLISHWYNNRIPFEKSTGTMEEYGLAVTSSLSYGALPRAL